MANTKKIVPEEKIETAVKAAEVKTEAAVPAAKKEDVPKTEKKRPGRKPKAAAEKAPVAKEEKAPAAKSAAKKDETVKTEKKRPGRKPAASKAAAKAPAKTTGKKAGTKKAEEKAPAKRGGRKKAVTLNNAVEAARKNVSGARISKIKYPIAVNVELSGSAEGIFYIFVSDGKIAVEPYKYDDYDVYIRADADEFMSVMNGKKNMYDALADGLIKIDGNTKKAVLFIHAVF